MGIKETHDRTCQNQKKACFILQMSSKEGKPKTHDVYPTIRQIQEACFIFTKMWILKVSKRESI